jgi:recombinational DNA repair protein (RecF pathway)
MAYQTYITAALVCGTFNRNTADRSYLLFTREAGMLFADARSIREERSKQRFAMQDFSFIRVSLVRGKSGWKIGSVQAETNFYAGATDKLARGSVVSLFRLLRRFFSGEEPAPELFDFIHQSLQLVSGEMLHRPVVEKFLHVKILTDLGYVDGSLVPEVLRGASPEVLAGQDDDGLIPILDQLIATAIATSHL